MPILLDIALVAILILFAWRGAAKGFVLTLCGLLAVVVSFVGACWISDQLTQPVSELIQPFIQTHIEELVEQSAQIAQDAIADLDLSIPANGQETAPPSDPSLPEVVDALRSSNLFSAMVQSVSDAIDRGLLTVVTSASAAVAAYLAEKLAEAGLFLLVFLFLMAAFWLVSHALDLAFRLPILRTLNETGGFLLGLLKGALLLLIACWAIRTLELIPPDTIHQTFLFHYFINFQAF